MLRKALQHFGFGYIQLKANLPDQVMSHFSPLRSRMSVDFVDTIFHLVKELNAFLNAMHLNIRLTSVSFAPWPSSAVATRTVHQLAGLSVSHLQLEYYNS